MSAEHVQLGVRRVLQPDVQQLLDTAYQDPAVRAEAQAKLAQAFADWLRLQEERLVLGVQPQLVARGVAWPAWPSPEVL